MAGEKVKIIISACAEIIGYNFILIKDYNLKQDIEFIHYEKTIRINNVIDRDKILKLDFGLKILKFIDVVKNNIDDKNLDNFYNNIKTLKIENFSYKNLKSGYYVGGNSNKIVVNSDIENILYHELFHMASTNNYTKGRMYILSGFSQGFFSEKSFSIANSLNEGYTEVLTTRYFGNYGNAFYFFERECARALEVIIGKKRMEELYFNANLSGLVNELIIYKEVNDIFSFFNDLDFLSEYLYKEDNSFIRKRMIINKLNNVSSFLLDCYIKKLITTNNLDDYNNKIDCFLDIIGGYISVRGQEYDYLSDSKIKRIINNNIKKNKIKVKNK